MESSSLETSEVQSKATSQNEEEASTSTQSSSNSKSSKLRRARKGGRKIMNKITSFLPFRQQQTPATVTSGGPTRVRGGVRLRGCDTDDEHKQITREIVERLRPLHGKEGLRIAGFEFRSVSLRDIGDSNIPELSEEIEDETQQATSTTELDEDPSLTSTRLFHVESNTMITLDNRKEFIADGDMYEALARLCQEYAQDVMVKEGKLEWTTISEQGNMPEPIRALVSTTVNTDETALDTTPTLLIATGKGRVRAGIFSREHLMCSGMECSTAIPIVIEAFRRQMNVIMIDPNVHGDRLGMRTFEASLSKLFSRWEQDNNATNQPPLGKRDLFVLSHSQSGAQLASYLLDKSKHYLPHIRAVVFTDSTHNIKWSRQDKELHDLLQSEKCVYFKVSKEESEKSLLKPLESLGREVETDNIWKDRFGEIKTRCAGTSEHSLTNWFARHHIWDHFDSYLKRHSPNQSNHSATETN